MIQNESANETCRFVDSESVTAIDSWRNIRSLDEFALKQAVALVGPVVAVIDASSPSFQVRFSIILDSIKSRTVSLGWQVVDKATCVAMKVSGMRALDTISCQLSSIVRRPHCIYIYIYIYMHTK